jgi:glycosyltransferase involved in cell wall biosynthesis
MTDVNVISSTADLNQYAFKEREPGFDIAYVGYLNYRKNPPLLLQCLHALVEKDERYHLHIAGEFQQAELEHYFEHMLDTLDLHEHVTLYGWVDDVASWLDDKHYFILPTLHEGNPYSVLEAAAKGIRPIVHTFPGSDTLYPDSWTFGSIPDLLYLVEEIRYDSSSYRRYVEKHYALSTTGDQIQSLLRNLVPEPAEDRAPHPLNGAQADGPSLKDLPRAPSGRTGWPWTKESQRLAPKMPNGREWPLTSIVMPSFNQGKYIEAAIRSVLLQGYPNLEFVVIDGGSTDETVEILEKYDPWITYWQSKPDEGQSDAINQGFERCSGLLAAWLNSDDMLCQDALYAHATRHLFEPDTIYVGNCLVVDKRGTVQSRHTGRVHTFESLINLKEVWRGQPRGHFIQPEVLFPLDAYRQVGGLSVDNHQTMDYELWGRLLLAGAQIKYTDLDVGMFRVHADQKTSQFWETTKSLTRSARRLIRAHPTWSDEKKKAFLSKLYTYEEEVAEQYRPPLGESSTDRHTDSSSDKRTAGTVDDTPQPASPPQVTSGKAASLPKVSAFMPTYNHRPFIAEAIESALTQEYPNLELVIGDDASTDGTREIIDTYYRKHPDVIKRIYADENGGITANCNRVLAACTGDYIAFTSGDDVWLPGKIQKQVEWFADHPDHVFCCTRVDMFKSETGRLLERGPDGDFEHIFAHPPPSRIYQLGTALSSVMIRREALPSGGYDPRIPHASDFLFMVSVLDKGPSGYIDEVLARYRKHAESASNKWSWVYTDHLMALKIMDQKFPQWADDIERIRKVTLHKLHRLHHSESPKQVLVNG